MMRALSLLAAGILLALSCSGPHSTRTVEQYLAQEYPGTQIEVTSIGEPRQLYSPFEVLNSLRLTASSAVSRKDLAASFYEGYSESARALQDLVRFSDSHPELCNRTGFVAWASINGRQKQVVVFLNRDGKTIGHTSLELLDAFDQIAHRLDALSYAY
ncbi:MAG: hypothetical protein II841_04720 [Bacteroidales bacterium]|nr:hypothetical protein [Bacteroidales bacterium]